MSSNPQPFSAQRLAVESNDALATAGLDVAAPFAEFHSSQLSSDSLTPLSSQESTVASSAQVPASQRTSELTDSGSDIQTKFEIAVEKVEELEGKLFTSNTKVGDLMSQLREVANAYRSFDDAWDQLRERVQSGAVTAEQGYKQVKAHIEKFEKKMQRELGDALKGEI